MAKVLFKANGRLYYGDNNRSPAWDTPNANSTVMRADLYYLAEEVYLERPDGHFKHMKSRFSTDLQPLTNKEAMMWVLKAEYFDIHNGL